MQEPILTNKSEVRFFSVLALILTVFLAFTFLIGRKELKQEEERQLAASTTPFDKVELTAKSAYVWDTKTGKILFAKNENDRLALASLTKVMTALVASEIAPTYSTVTVSRSAIETSGDSGLRVGERWLLRDLLDFSLVSSANDGMRAVALSLGALHDSDISAEDIVNDFVHRMNVKADEIGMKNTYFFNDTGLDESIVKGGAYGTARDVALLFSYILKNDPSLLSATRESSMTVTSLDNISHRAKNTDIAVGKIPGLLASKTGYTDLAGGNLVVAFDPELGRPIIISVLGSTEQGRFKDMLGLVSASLEALRSSPQAEK